MRVEVWQAVRANCCSALRATGAQTEAARASWARGQAACAVRDAGLRAREAGGRPSDCGVVEEASSARRARNERQCAGLRVRERLVGVPANVGD